MRCQQAKEYFDAYLDGDLSPSLATELGAHRLQCPECRRALALLEVSEHMIASSRDPVTVRIDFTDRLLACMEKTGLGGSRERIRRWIYLGVPSAFAALVALAFLGVFDRGGKKEVAGLVQPASIVIPVNDPLSFSVEEGDGSSNARAENLDTWFGRMEHRIETKRRSMESLQQAFQWFDVSLIQPLPAAHEPSETDADVSADSDEETSDNTFELPSDSEPDDETGDED